MAACDQCGFSWVTPMPHAIQAIAHFPERAVANLVTVSDGAVRMRPSPEVWSAIEYAAHTGDAIGWYHERVVRALTEDRPLFTAFDWDAACDERRYGQRSVDVVVAEVEQSCDGFVSGLGHVTADELARVGVGSDGSMRSVETLVRRAAHEAVHHADDISHVLHRSGRGRG